MISNNDILRRIRYAFSLEDDQMIKIFSFGNRTTDRAEVSNWLKKDIDDDYKDIIDKDLAAFLNGFITYKRGAKDGPKPVAESRLNNNLIFRKLKIALALKDVDVVSLMAKQGQDISRHEVNAFLRNPKQRQYRVLQDQILRNFIYALQKM